MNMGSCIYLEGFGLSWKRKLKSNAVPTIMPKPTDVHVTKKPKRSSAAREKREKLQVSRNVKKLIFKFL